MYISIYRVIPIVFSWETHFNVYQHIPGDPIVFSWETLFNVYQHIPGDSHSVQLGNTCQCTSANIPGDPVVFSWGTLFSVHLHIPGDSHGVQLGNTCQCASANIPGNPIAFSRGTLQQKQHPPISPCKVRSSNTLTSFKSSVKSHLIKLSY